MPIKIHRAAAILTTPQVPRYEATEQAQAIRAPRAQGLGADAFGGGLAQGLGQAANAMQQDVQREREKADRTATIEARTGLSQLEADLLYDGKTGALTKRGKESFGLPEPTLKTFDERAAEIEGRLTTPAQKEAFRLLAAQQRTSINTQVQRHIAGEMKTYAAETNKAALETTINNVATHYLDPARIEQERKFGLAVILSDTDTAGLPPEAVKLRAQTWDSTVHRAVVERFASSGNPTKAMEYLDANRDRLLPDDAAKLDNTLKPLAEAQQGFEAAGEVFATAGEGARLDELLRGVRERFADSPGARKHAESEIRSLYQAREESQRQGIEDAENAVYSYLAKVKLNGGTPSRSDVPAEAWAALSKVAPEKVSQIAGAILSGQEHATDRARTSRERVETTTTTDNLTTWGLLKTDPFTLRNTNLDALLTQAKINKSQYQDLITDQLAIKQGKGEKEAQLLSDKAAVDLVLQAVGISQKKNPEQYGKFYDAMSARMRTFEGETGKRPRQEDVKNMARGLLGEVTQERSWWVDKTVPAFDADVEKVIVPVADRSAIRKALETNGLPVTEEAIRQTYLDRVQRGK